MKTRIYKIKEVMTWREVPRLNRHTRTLQVNYEWINFSMIGFYWLKLAVSYRYLGIPFQSVGLFTKIISSLCLSRMCMLQKVMQKRGIGAEMLKNLNQRLTSLIHMKLKVLKIG